MQLIQRSSLPGKQQPANAALRPAFMHQLQTPQLRGNSLHLQTVTGTTPTGSVQLLIDPVTRSGTIVNLLVGQEHRRQGVGTKLMQAAVAQAKLHGLSGLSLEARSPEPTFPAARLASFYRRLGFLESGPALRGGSKMGLPLQMQRGPMQAQPIQAKRGGGPVFAPIPRMNPVQPKKATGPIFAPVPRLGFAGSQVVQRAVATVNVSDLRFTQASVSPTFSSVPTGNPDNLDASASAVKKSTKHPAWLQLINVFKLRHDDWGSNVYTLDNRRAYVLQKSGLTSFTPTWANLETVYNNLFKFSAADDSKSIKLLTTKADPALPSEYSLLGQFVRAILAAFNVATIAALPAWGPNSAGTLAQVVADFHFNQ